MKIAIIDDASSDRTLVKKWINTYFDERENEYLKAPDYDEFKDGESFLDDFTPGSYDLLILDIYMNKLSGLDVAKRVSAIDKSCNIILFTNSKDHQLDGYIIHAIGYVLKPVGKHLNALYAALDYVIEKMEMDKASISVKTAFGDLTLQFRNIFYIDCINRTVNIHLPSQTLEVIGKYKDIRHTFLSDNRFLECNRNLIVNMDYVDRLSEDDFVLKSGEYVPISRRKKVTALEYYMKYFINRIG